MKLKDAPVNLLKKIHAFLTTRTYENPPALEDNKTVSYNYHVEPSGDPKYRLKQKYISLLPYIQNKLNEA